MQTKDHLLTQLDYIKILIDENRLAESHDRLDELKSNLSLTCDKIKEKMVTSQIEIPKSLTKTKPNQWMFINQNWVKVISINKQELTFELNKGNTAKIKYVTKKGF